MQKLKITLLANMTFSILSGLTLLLAATPVAAWMGVGNPLVLRLIGAGLLLFAGQVYATARSKRVSRTAVQLIIVQDWLWVAGSALIVLTGAFGLSGAGYWIIGIVAVLIADFAIFQQLFLRRAATQKSNL